MRVKARFQRLQVVKQPPGPIGVGFNHADHVDEQNEGVVAAPVFHRVQAGYERRRRASRQLDRDGEPPIPQARVVGAEVAEVGALLQQGFENLRGQAVGGGDTSCRRVRSK